MIEKPKSLHNWRSPVIYAFVTSLNSNTLEKNLEKDGFTDDQKKINEKSSKYHRQYVFIKKQDI